MSIQSRACDGVLGRLLNENCSECLTLDDKEYSDFYDNYERYFTCKPSLEYRFFKEKGFIFGKEIAVGCDNYRDMKAVYKEFYYHQHPEERPKTTLLGHLLTVLFDRLH